MRRVKAARASIVSNTSLVVLKLTVGVLMMSISVISEAIHSMMDLVAAIIANYSVRKSSQPADEDHAYGHGKFENVSGLVEALLIFLAAGIILFEAGQKLLLHGTVEFLDAGIVVMGISAGVNFFVSRYLYKVAKEEDSIALEADALHLRTDVWTSFGIFLGLVAIKLTNIMILDPLIAIGVALMIIRAAWDLTKRSSVGLLDRRLPSDEEAVIRQALDRHSAGYLSYHSVRSRRAGSEKFVDMHLVVKFNLSVEESHELADELEKEIETDLRNTSVVIHIEPCDTLACFERSGVNHCILEDGEDRGGCYEKERERKGKEASSA